MDTGDMQTIAAKSRQQVWLAKLLKAVAAGTTGENQKSYSPLGKAPILASFGPERSTAFPMMATSCDWITRTMNGKDAATSKYRKLLGYG
ncbi:MAG: hypothetical protein AAF729_00195 [Pseudomonadota bacterium]